MKKILLLILVVLCSFVTAQGQNGNGGQEHKAQKFDAVKFVGIFYYQENKAIKKIKIKKENLKYYVKKELKSYNNKIKVISFLKSQELKEITSLVNTIKQSGDREKMKDFKFRIEKVLDPIKDSIQSLEKQLNATLEGKLSKKQFKSWIKFQKKRKRELIPEAPAPERRRAPPRNTNNRRRRRY
jgi:hypothetical protein